MKKTPFLSVVSLALIALFLSLATQGIGNPLGSQLCLGISVCLFIGYAALRIIYDLVPDKYVRGEREGRSA